MHLASQQSVVVLSVPAVPPTSMLDGPAAVVMPAHSGEASSFVHYLAVSDHIPRLLVPRDVEVALLPVVARDYHSVLPALETHHC